MTTRKPIEDILSAELDRLLKQTLSASFSDLFKGLRDGLPNINASSGDTAMGGGLNIIINNNASASVTAQESQGPFNQKYLEITIDQMVANSLLQGRQTTGVMRTLFGLVPSLTGR